MIAFDVQFIYVIEAVFQNAIYLFILFIKYIKRVTQLAIKSSLPCGPL